MFKKLLLRILCHLAVSLAALVPASNGQGHLNKIRFSYDQVPVYCTYTVFKRIF
jgi:hypothetical protein